MKGIDPRGPRFGAAITSIVLALALVLPSPWSTGLATLQWLAFAAGALLGVKYQPYGMLYRATLAPRLGPPAELEDPRPPRFAQAVGLVFVTVALFGAALGAAWVFQIAVGLALLAALLNAVFDVCLGCEMYVRLQRLTGDTA